MITDRKGISASGAIRLVTALLVASGLMLFLAQGMMATESQQSRVRGTATLPTVTPVATTAASYDFLESLMPPDSGLAGGTSAPILHQVEEGSYRTAPADLPRVTATAGQGAPAPGYIFVSVFDTINFASRNGYMMILDNSGEPVFYRNIPPYPVTMDFKQQPDGRLTYFLPGPGINAHFALDNHYEIVATYKAGNGYSTDLHDLQILPNGHALLMIHDARKVDLGELVPGGRPDATVIGCILQEIDTGGNVLFEWSSWDHISILDTVMPLDTEPLRYIHCNSVERDTDGHWLVSNRNLNNVIKISRTNGEVIWQLGGKNNQFTINDDTPFLFQHDARRLANGHLTIYDNGFGRTRTYSRGVEYALDEVAMTATKVAEFARTPFAFGGTMGNMQRLANGHTVIGWGRSSAPMVTEFDAAGDIVLEMSVAAPLGSYRAFRFPWQGFPTADPALVVEERLGAVRLYFSWNGSTETVRYVVFGGKDKDRLAVLGTAVRHGFETTYDFDLPDKDPWYFRVVPIDKDGLSGPPSPLVSGRYSTAQAFLPLVR